MSTCTTRTIDKGIIFASNRSYSAADYLRIVVAASATVSQFTTTRAIGKNIIVKTLLPLYRYLSDHSTIVAAKTMVKLDALLCYAAISYTRRQLRTADWGAAAGTAVSLLAVSKMTAPWLSIRKYVQTLIKFENVSKNAKRRLSMIIQ